MSSDEFKDYPVQPPGELARLHHAFPALGGRGFRLLARVAERFLALDEINRIHAATADEPDPCRFLARVLEEFGVRYDVSPNELLRIPSEGPVVVVSNHPFGGLDAIILTAMLSGLRDDARILANHLLLRIPQVRPLLFGVDPFGGLEAARRNVRGMQRAMEHLMDGGLLGIFPSGTVSHFQVRRMVVEDPPWTTHLFKLVRHSGATVVPVYFEGRNSVLFQAAGVLHPLLRTAMIPREAVRRRGATFRIAVGRSIPSARMERFDEAARFTRFLRLRTQVLGGSGKRGDRVSKIPAQTPARVQAVARAEDPATLVDEISRLPEEDVVLRDGNFRVIVARWSRDEALLREIGRLRELTFREAGEGSGKARDLDKFDRHYLQLVLWDDREGRVAGGYRMARVDHTLKEHGRDGLYTATLFKFRQGFLRELGPAMELGRSWIRTEYQRKHNALALLWRGIATLIVRQPETCILLGPVSISRDYQPLSRGLIVSFLRDSLGDPQLASSVKPVKPYRMHGRNARIARDAGKAVRSIDDVSVLVSEIESDGKGVPLLFRHYLRLHSIVLSFNVDPAFADVVDGLLLTDLRRTDPKILRRFMGEDGLAEFQAFHAGLGKNPATEKPSG